MKQLKKTIVSLVMALLLAVTLIPSTNVTVQAASVGKVTGIKAVYTKGKTKLTWKKASRAKKYEIYRSTNGKKFKKVKTVKGLSWQDTKKENSGIRYVPLMVGKKENSAVQCRFIQSEGVFHSDRQEILS